MGLLNHITNAQQVLNLVGDRRMAQGDAEAAVDYVCDSGAGATLQAH